MTLFCERNSTRTFETRQGCWSATPRLMLISNDTDLNPLTRTGTSVCIHSIVPYMPDQETTGTCGVLEPRCKHTEAIVWISWSSMCHYRYAWTVKFVLLKCCFTSTETVGLLGTGAQDGHLDLHTAPELWSLSCATPNIYGCVLTVHRGHWMFS